MRPHHSLVRVRALAPAYHRQDAMLGAAALALVMAFAVLAAGWQLGGVALHMLGLAS